MKRIALAQLDPIVGDVDGNVRSILEACAEAKAQGAELVVLSELIITGYPPRDLLNIAEFRQVCDAAVDRLVRELPDDLHVIFGAPRARERNGFGGRALWNSAVVARRGEIIAEIPKALLPTYDVFDERRYFEPAPEHTTRVFDLGGARVGITICEDMWNDRLFWGDARLYDRDPVAEAMEQGAELIVNVSASPYAQRKFEVRRKMVSHAARRWGVPIVYVNAVGGNDGLLFDGHSHAFAADGSPIVELPLFERAVRTVDLAERCALPEIDPTDVLQRALVSGVRDYARKTGMSRWVIGLSGGVDSALVAAIGSLALGAENGMALGMPSRYSSDHSVADARALASRLRLPFEVVPIEPAHAAYEAMLGPALERDPAGPGDVTWENVQARIRGATLMAWANRTGALLLTTGNKSECAVGYCTLYGDMCGGLAVIADVYKHEVYGLCRWLNDHLLDGAIPERTLTKPPSAELRPGQRDDQSLPPYDVLDPILASLVDHERGAHETARITGQPLELVRNVARMVHRAEYKRQQFAPSLKVSPRAWVGRDYPIAMGWRP
ncbi:MAG: NAD+ synthase [Deltaproteobacteria bacterium]|nr:NAD+ synthase [Deltaproteobacteria bacterium]